VAQAIPSVARALDGIVARVTQGGRLFYIGAGTSGRLGVLDAAECPPTFRVPPDLVQGIIAGGERALARATEASEDSEEMGARDLLEREFTGKDALVGIAASGRTPYVLGAVDRAREIGALTVGISCTPDSELAKRVEIALTLLAGPEIIAGSTRMKAGTATKMALNMLSTGLMIRLGHTFGNLMVNVAEAAGVDSQRAARILEDAGNNVKTAVVMGRGGLTRQEAEQRLESVGGVIVKALKWTS
jgi:N-acetylmuramic acid 6-phosphate etherase